MSVIFQIRAEPEGANSSPTPSPTSPTFAARKNSNNSTDRPMEIRSGSLDHSDSANYVDTKTPYISRLIEQKSGRSGRLMKPSTEDTNNVANKNEVSVFFCC